MIGLELGSVWRRLGADVTILEGLPTFLGAVDEQIAKEAKKAFDKQGLKIELGVKVGEVKVAKKGVSIAYTNAKGDNVEVQITGDSAMVMQIATVLSNPQFAGAMGKLIRVGQQRAIQNSDGDVNMVVNNKFLITIQGSADAASKVAYANEIDVARLSKM